MKNLLLSFLSLVMVSLVGCTADFAALDEVDVTQPIITSSLDDVVFSANFTTRTTATTSFVIDPKSHDITRSNFEVSFDDANANEEYIVSTITESSATNGYTLRLTPTTLAVSDLVDTYMIKCYIDIVLEDGRKTKYSIDVTLSGDEPEFFAHPTDIVFPVGFTVDSLMSTTFSVNYGACNVPADSITVSASGSYSRYFDIEEIILLSDSANIASYEMILSPTTQATRNISDSDIEITAAMNIMYNSNSAPDDFYTVSSYDFTITFSAVYEPYTFAEKSVADLVFAENYTDSVSTSYARFTVDLGTDNSSVLNNLRFRCDAADSLTGKYYIRGAENADELTDSYFTQPSTGVYRLYLCANHSNWDYPDGLYFQAQIYLVTDWDVYDEANPVEGVGCEMRTMNVVMPPMNRTIPPTISTSISMIEFNSDIYSPSYAGINPNVKDAYSDGVQKAASTSSAAYSLTDLVYNFTINRGCWPDVAIKDSIEMIVEYADGTTSQRGWIDEDSSFATLAYVTETDDYGIEYDRTGIVDSTGTGYLYDEYQIQFMLTSTFDADFDAHYKNAAAYETFIGDTGTTYVYFRLKYSWDDATNSSIYLDTDKFPVRYYPPTPMLNGEQYDELEILYAGEFILIPYDFLNTDVWVQSLRDYDNLMTWEQAEAYCESKEAHPGLPWGWRLPTSQEGLYISYGRSVIYTNLLNAASGANQSYVPTAGAALYKSFWTSTIVSDERAYGIFPNGYSRVSFDRGDQMTVICVTEKFQYDEYEIPDAGDFN